MAVSCHVGTVAAVKGTGGDIACNIAEAVSNPLGMAPLKST